MNMEQINMMVQMVMQQGQVSGSSSGFWSVASSRSIDFCLLAIVT